MAGAESNSSYFDKHIDTINPDAIWDLMSRVSAFEVNVDWFETFHVLLHKFLQKDSRLDFDDGKKMLDLLGLVDENTLASAPNTSKKQIQNLRKLVKHRIQVLDEISDETRNLDRTDRNKIESSKLVEQQEVYFGKYRRIKKLGSGNMGVVYLAEHRDSKKQYALKLLHSRNLNNIEDVENEARAAMKISHDNCVQVMGIIHHGIYDPMHGETRKIPIVVAEYVDGLSLGDLLDHKMFQDLVPRGAFSRLAALLIVEQITQGLAACHHVGVIHRDIKPDNCIVLQSVIDRLIEAYRKNWGLEMSEVEAVFTEEREKGKAWIKISDLGSALIAEPKGDDFTFSVKKFIPGGSPAYMAPESVRDEVSGRTDIFALGMTLYQLLTGRNPREARQVAEGINALKYQSSYVYLEDLRKAKATHAVDLEADTAFAHFRAEDNSFGDNSDILELLRQMTVRDRRSRIRTTTCKAAVRTMVNCELKEKKIQRLLKVVDQKDASIAGLEDENKAIKKYYAGQLKNYQGKVKLAQALEENLENELGKRDDELRELKTGTQDYKEEAERANRHLKGITGKKEKLEETLRLVRKELGRVGRKLSDRERSLSKSEEATSQLYETINTLRARSAEAQKILEEKHGYACSMSEKIEQLQEMLGDLSNLNYFMQISQSLSLFPSLEDSATASFSAAPNEATMDPSSTTFKRSAEDEIEALFNNLKETLVLSGLSLKNEQIAVLKENPKLSQVTHIIFEGRPLSSVFLDFIVNSPHLKKVTTLEIRECKVSVKAMKKLIAADSLNKLEKLSLEDTDLATDAVKLLAKSSKLTNLETLSLAHNMLEAAGAKTLANARCLQAVRQLNLESNGLDKDDIEMLLESKYLKQLTALNLNDNHVGPEGCQALAAAKNLQHLRELNLNGNRIGPAGLEYILDSKHLIELQVLHLEHNELGVDGARRLAEAKQLNGLEQLTLGANVLGDNGVAFLAQSKLFQNLNHLDLGGNTIGVKGARSLAGCDSLSQLQTLNLNLNCIKEEGAKALAATEQLKKLAVLNLYLNQINDGGLAALASSNKLPALRSLDIGANGISDQGAQRLLDSPLIAKLEDLVLFSNSISEDMHNKIEDRIKGLQDSVIVSPPFLEA
jgi:serine/threonine protein kinase